MTIYKNFIDNFEPGDLLEKDFHHKEHLIICLWYLEKFEELDAILRIKHGVMKYNLIYNVPQREKRGYHETITMFFIQLTQKVRRSIGPNLSFDEKVDLLVEECPEVHSTLAKYYSKDYLWSPEGRRFWLKPDVKEL